MSLAPDTGLATQCVRQYRHIL